MTLLSVGLTQIGHHPGGGPHCRSMKKRESPTRAHNFKRILKSLTKALSVSIKQGSPKGPLLEFLLVYKTTTGFVNE